MSAVSPESPWDGLCEEENMPGVISLFRNHLRALGGVLLVSTLLIGPVGSASSATRGQEVTGNIQGEVKDQAGGLVHNATVTATSEQHTFTATTNSEGVYRLNNIPPGVYTVVATMKGFNSAKVDNVIVELGKTLNVVLEVKVAGTQEV